MPRSVGSAWNEVSTSSMSLKSEILEMSVATPGVASGDVYPKRHVTESVMAPNMTAKSESFQNRQVEG